MSERKIIRIKDVMVQDYVIVSDKQTIEEIIHISKEAKARIVIVDKRHENDEYSVILPIDIARQVLAKDRSPSRVNAYEIMSKPAIGVDPEMDIRYCARLLSNFGLTWLPVINQGKILGVVSYREIVFNS